jgi:hypothetical protein
MSSISSWYCILTNGFCIFPCFVLCRRSLWGDFVLYLTTGVASFMYHLNNLEVNFLNDVAIRNTDIILANLSVFHTVNLLCLYDTPTRWNYTVACLPLVIYTAEYGLVLRFVLMITYSVLGMVYVVLHRANYVTRWVVPAVVCIVGELLFFSYGNEGGSGSYEWLHGSHHVMAFTSLYSFIKSIKFPELN